MTTRTANGAAHKRDAHRSTDQPDEIIPAFEKTMPIRQNKTMETTGAATTLMRPENPTPRAPRYPGT